jgi:hypothetical protein
MRRLLTTVAVIIALGLGTILGIRIFSGEDSWLCANGEWVRHGQPLAPQPTTPCETKLPSISYRIFFSNRFSDPQSLNCEKTYGAERSGPTVVDLKAKALQELLAGPTIAEQADGYFTSINEGVQVQRLEIKDGTAYVDFSKQIEAAVGGSCRVLAIRSQIENTLKQFPDIQKVVISVDGRVADALQP